MKTMFKYIQVNNFYPNLSVYKILIKIKKFDILF